MSFIPPYPPRPTEPLSTLEMLRRGRRNFLTAFEDRAFEYQLVSLKILSRTLFICNSPDTVKQAFVTANASFERKSPQLRHGLKPLLGDGLFISDGDIWKARRRIVAPIVHSSRMPDFSPVMVDAAREMRERWRSLSQIDASVEMAHLTAEIICRTIFGSNLGRKRAHETVEGFRDFQERVGQLDLVSLAGLPDWVPRLHPPAVRRSVARIIGTLDDVIAEYQRGSGEASVIGMLLDARDATGAPLPAEAIRNEAAVIFLAGHETTANCLAWAWYLLSQDAESERRLHAELDQVLAGRAPTLADLPALPYTRAVIEETLRLYPPVPLLAREAVADERLRKRDVPKGSLVLVVPWLLHRHRRYWEQPDHFMPERFLPGAPPIDKYVYVPFSVGPRVCAGLAFGLTEAILCLATLAQDFRLTLRPEANIEPVCRLTLRPSHGVPMDVHARKG